MPSYNKKLPLDEFKKKLKNIKNFRLATLEAIKKGHSTIFDIDLNDEDTPKIKEDGTVYVGMMFAEPIKL